MNTFFGLQYDDPPFDLANPTFDKIKSQLTTLNEVRSLD